MRRKRKRLQMFVIFWTSTKNTHKKSNLFSKSLFSKSTRGRPHGCVGKRPRFFQNGAKKKTLILPRQARDRHTRNDGKSDCIFPSQEASGRQLIYKNHATAAAEAAADGVEGGGNGGGGGEGGRRKRMLRKR